MTLEEIIKKIEDYKTLTIRTIVGDFEFDDETKIFTENENTKIIISNIDLIEGDITTAFSEDFLKPPYDKVREYHSEKEKQGYEIIKSNIAALKEFIELIAKAYDTNRKI